MQLGRKGTIQLGNLLVCIGALLQASTYSVAQIIVGRIVTGCGIGCIAAAVPTYMAEMSLEAAERGPEISYQLALLISGIPLAYWIVSLRSSRGDTPNAECRVLTMSAR